MDDVEIDIDTWPGVNTFVEFEGKNSCCIEDVICKLGMNFQDSTTLDVKSIYLSLGYKEEDMNNLSFKEEKKYGFQRVR